MNNTADMVYWITERERMRKRREDVFQFPMWQHGWSDNPIMGQTRWCNVRREDDRVTKWLAEHWRPNHHAVWEIVLARMINYIPSLSELLTRCEYEGWSPSYLGVILKDRRERGDKMFTSAYTISTCGESMDKIDYVMRVVEDCKSAFGEFYIYSDSPITLAAAHAQMMQIMGLGSFLAAQVVADLKNTKGHALQDASDWHTWAAHGPGSLRGLEAYFGTRVSPSNFAAALATAWGEVKPELPENLQDLHMQDFQNCMCEFSKYMRVKNGDGRVRNKYSAG